MYNEKSFDAKTTTEDNTIDVELRQNELFAKIAAISRGQDESSIDIQHMEAEAYNNIRKELFDKIKNYGGSHNDYMMLEHYFGEPAIARNERFDNFKEFISRDRELLLKAGRYFPEKVMEAACEDFRKDKDFVMTIMKNTKRSAPEVLLLASNELRDNDEVIKEAIRQHPYSIAAASERIKNIPEIILLAANENPNILKMNNAFCYKNEEYFFMGDIARKKIGKLLQRVDTVEEGTSSTAEKSV